MSELPMGGGGAARFAPRRARPRSVSGWPEQDEADGIDDERKIIELAQERGAQLFDLTVHGLFVIETREEDESMAECGCTDGKLTIEAKTAHPRHQHIADNGIGWLVAHDQLQRTGRPSRFNHLEAATFQEPPQGPPDGWVVVNNQDFGHRNRKQPGPPLLRQGQPRN